MHEDLCGEEEGRGRKEEEEVLNHQYASLSHTLFAGNPHLKALFPMRPCVPFCFLVSEKGENVKVVGGSRRRGRGVDVNMKKKKKRGRNNHQRIDAHPPHKDPLFPPTRSG